MMGIAEMIRDGVDYHRAGHLDQAEGLYRRVLGEEPENPAVLHLLAALAHQRGQSDVALDLVRRAIAGDAGVAEFHNTLGAILQAVGKSHEALNAYRRAVSLRPDYAEAYNNMAMVLQGRGECSNAIEMYRQAAQCDPDCAEIHYNLASALKSGGRPEEAADSYKRSLELKPDYAEAYNNLAIILREQGQIEQATENYRQAIRLEPDCVQFHSNLASILQHQGRLAEAIVHCEHAVRLDPECAEGYYNLASALRDHGRCGEAIENNKHAIRLRPDFAEAHWNLSHDLLLNGDFAEGWEEYDWWRCDLKDFNYPHQYDIPRWDGESFVGKRLFVHWEQGFGDNLQFVRYLPLVKARGGTLIFESPKSMFGLFREFPGIDELVEVSSDHRPDTQFDLYAPLLDMPRIFGSTLDAIPADVPYIFADSDRVDYWRQKLAGPAFKVGIVWSGNPRHGNDHRRSCALEYFSPLAQIDAVRLYGLQKGKAGAQTRQVSPEMAVTNLGEDFKDFADTAAAIENMDLVVSVDTAVTHLAGALGKRVWTILPFAPDWRWMLGRADSL